MTATIATGSDTDGAAIDLARVEAFAYQVATDQARASAGVLAWVGDRLGLWAALAEGPATSVELAARTGCAERHLREWLATQVAVGYAEYDPATGRFRLPAEHAAVLADRTSPADQSGGFESVVSFFAAADRLAEAYRTGGGIPWGEHDPRLYSGCDRFFRPLYEASLVGEWLPAVEGAVERLTRGARVLDVGCGHGTAELIMARAFPASTFRGIDVHAGSVAAAREAAADAGVADRVEFAVADAGAPLGEGYDLVCFFDSFHHVGDPVAAARRAREALAADGALVLVEPRAADRLEANLDLVGLTWYGASAIVCVPDAMSQGATDALGGPAGPARLADVLTRAGFTRVRVAAEGPFNIVVEARG
jgi:SAM-dependent methyltransferase